MPSRSPLLAATRRRTPPDRLRSRRASTRRARAATRHAGTDQTTFSSTHRAAARREEAVASAARSVEDARQPRLARGGRHHPGGGVGVHGLGRRDSYLGSSSPLSFAAEGGPRPAQARPPLRQASVHRSAKHLFTLVNRTGSHLALPPLGVAAPASPSPRAGGPAFPGVPSIRMSRRGTPSDAGALRIGSRQCETAAAAP
jgi:hypothetical protein